MFIWIHRLRFHTRFSEPHWMVRLCRVVHTSHNVLRLQPPGQFATRTTTTGQLPPGQMPSRTTSIQNNRHPDNCHPATGQLPPRTTAIEQSPPGQLPTTTTSLRHIEFSAFISIGKPRRGLARLAKFIADAVLTFKPLFGYILLILYNRIQSHAITQAESTQTIREKIRPFNANT